MALGHTIIGTGSRTVMVLHEWLGDATNYEPLHPYLNKQDFRFCFVDLRGYGRSLDMPGDFTLQEISADVLELATLLKADNFHLIGHSMSGMVAQRLALDAPQRVLSVIAITPVFAGGFKADADALKRMLAVATDGGAVRDAIAARTSGRYDCCWLEFKATKAGTVSSEEARLGYLRMFTGAGFAEEASGNPVHMLVLFGKYDIPAYQYAHAAPIFAGCFPSAKFIEIEGAGHYPMLETPVFLAARINEFLACHSALEKPQA